MAAAVVAALPAWSGPPLAAPRNAELVDHVVPAVVVLLASAGALLARRAPLAVLGSGLVVSLCGLWMTATHLPLAQQAAQGGVPWPATAYHGLPGLAVLALGGVWSARSWDAADRISS